MLGIKDRLGTNKMRKQLEWIIWSVLVVWLKVWKFIAFIECSIASQLVSVLQFSKVALKIYFQSNSLEK